MAKKRTSNANALQAEFWTALPIDECRARIIALQRSSTVLERDQQTPTTSDPAFSSFTYAHYREVRYPKRKDKMGNTTGYQFFKPTIEGQLHATIDGTRVTLKLAESTARDLGTETALKRLVMAFLGALAVIWLSHNRFPH